jgi:hypothetical protein
LRVCRLQTHTSMADIVKRLDTAIEARKAGKGNGSPTRHTLYEACLEVAASAGLNERVIWVRQWVHGHPSRWHNDPN